MSRVTGSSRSSSPPTSRSTASAPQGTPSSATGGSSSATATSGSAWATAGSTGPSSTSTSRPARSSRSQVPFDEDVERRGRAAPRPGARHLARRRRSSRPRKAAAAERLPFPHTAPRPGPGEDDRGGPQRPSATGENLLAEAPTGSGKTAAALHPALAEGLATGRQVVFLTSKTLQQKMAVSALVAMNERAFHTVQVRAKDRMCANDRIICHEDFCRFAKDYPDKMERSNLLGRLRDTYSHLDPDTVFEEARREEVCPFEVQLELAAARRRDRRRLQLRLRARRRAAPPDRRGPARGDPAGRRGAQPARTGRARSSRPRSSRRSSPLLRNRLSLQPGELFADIVDLGRDSRGDPRRGGRGPSRGRGDRGDRAAAEADPRAARGLGAEAACATSRGSGRRASRSSTIRSSTSTSRCSASPPCSRCSGPTSRAVVERRAAGIRLALVCLDPARALAPIFRAGLLDRAALGDADAARGDPPRARPRGRPHVVDLAAAAVPAREPQGDRSFRPCERPTRRASGTTAGSRTLLAEMSDAHGGNDLVLFPSYRFLTAVAERMPPTRSRLLVQRPDLTAFERQQLLEALSSPPPGGTLLFAVSGGMYAEGVDYPGRAALGRLRRLAGAAPGLLRAGAAAPLLRRPARRPASTTPTCSPG